MAEHAHNTPAEALHSEPTDEDVGAWIARFRELGGHFQWLDPKDEVVWIGCPVASDAAAFSFGVGPALRLRVIEAAKALLRANGGFY